MVANRQVTFSPAPASGTLIVIKRQTSTERLVSWQDASVLKASDMTLAQVQQLHILEEQQDWIKTNSMVTDDENRWNALNHRIINVSDPINDQDAVTKNYVENLGNSFKTLLDTTTTQDIQRLESKTQEGLAALDRQTTLDLETLKALSEEMKEIAKDVNVFIPSVTENIISWTNKAGLPNPDPVNIKGEQGMAGKDGTAATITIGTVTTGEPGSNASVTNVGTDTAAVLAISIPRGDKGADGVGAGDVIAAANNTFTAWNFFERLPRYTGTATNASSTEFLTKSIADTYYLGTDITQNVSFRGSNNFYGSVYLRNTVSVSGTITVPTPTTSSQAVNKGYVDTAVATTPAQLKTQSDMQLNTVITSTSLKADSTNVQSYTITSGGGIGISYFDASATLAGYVKTFVISVTRSGGAGTFKIGANHRIGDNIPSVYMVDGALPDIADGEVLKIAMEVNEPANAIFIYILGKVAL